MTDQDRAAQVWQEVLHILFMDNALVLTQEENCINILATYGQEQFRAGVEASRETTRMILMDDDYNCWMCEKCHNDWQIMEGTPFENNMKYCTRCGRRIIAEVVEKDEEDDELLAEQEQSKEEKG